MRCDSICRALLDNERAYKVGLSCISLIIGRMSSWHGRCCLVIIFIRHLGSPFDIYLDVSLQGLRISKPRVKSSLQYKESNKEGVPGNFFRLKKGWLAMQMRYSAYSQSLMLFLCGPRYIPWRTQATSLTYHQNRPNLEADYVFTRLGDTGNSC
jgi:hypothetical protein